MPGNGGFDVAERGLVEELEKVGGVGLDCIVGHAGRGCRGPAQASFEQPAQHTMSELRRCRSPKPSLSKRAFAPPKGPKSTHPVLNRFHILNTPKRELRYVVKNTVTQWGRTIQIYTGIRQFVVKTAVVSDHGFVN